MTDQPMTTAGLQAKVALRSAWFEAHPNQPITQGREEVDELIAAIEAEAEPSGEHKPGESHHYRIICSICGQRGQVQLSIEPQAPHWPTPPVGDSDELDGGRDETSTMTAVTS